MDQKYARLSLLQVDFLAQDELVEVHAYSDFPKLELTCGVWGPFQRLGTYMVPLWLALQLHTKRVVRVIPPSWLTPADLEQVCAAERMSQPDLSALPLHWLSVATLLLDHCPACFGGDSNVTQVRRAVENVRNIREEKLRMVIAGPPSSTTATTSQQPSKLSNAYLHLDNVSLLELNCIRDFTTSAMDEYASFRKMNPQPATPQQTPVKVLVVARLRMINVVRRLHQPRQFQCTKFQRIPLLKQ